MFIAGESSGDMRAAGLARALKKLESSLRLTGVGGPYMRQAGVECFNDITQLAVIGIVEVIKNFDRIKKVFDQILERIDATKPDALVLVDYPHMDLLEEQMEALLRLAAPLFHLVLVVLEAAPVLRRK